MKKIRIIFLLVMIVCFSSTYVKAENFVGEILDIFGENITTMQFEKKPDFNVGDHVSVTYMAGITPMIIGTYEVTTVRDKAILAKPIFKTMDPSAGMKVHVFVLKKSTTPPKEEKKQVLEESVETEKWTRAPIEDAPDLKSEEKEVQITIEVELMEIHGEVFEVMGKDIRVAIKDNGVPREGWFIDVFYVTNKGKELPVGTWKVTSVEGQMVFASEFNVMGKARKGLKALMYNGGTKAPAKNNVSGAGDLGSLEEFMTEPRTFRDVQANQPPPIQLLGETAPRTPRFYPPKEKENLTLKQEIMRDFERAKEEAAFEDFKKELVALQGSSERMAARGLYSAGTAGRYWLGVEIAENKHVIGQAFAAGPMGIRVLAVFSKSPAKKAGLETADIIYEANGIQVSGTAQFIDILNDSPKGKLQIKIQRNGKIIEKTIKLKKMKH